MSNLVQPAIAKQFGSIQKSGWRLKHGCGVASGKSLLVRAGFRGNDDMISIGTAPNLAAKLSDERQGKYATLIGKNTYNQLTGSLKLSKGVNMWEGPFTYSMGGKNYAYYKTSYHWSF